MWTFAWVETLGCPWVMDWCVSRGPSGLTVTARTGSSTPVLDGGRSKWWKCYFYRRPVCQRIDVIVVTNFSLLHLLLFQRVNSSCRLQCWREGMTESPLICYHCTSTHQQDNNLIMTSYTRLLSSWSVGWFLLIERRGALWLPLSETINSVCYIFFYR